jgi:hypothetical protein
VEQVQCKPAQNLTMPGLAGFSGHCRAMSRGSIRSRAVGVHSDPGYRVEDWARQMLRVAGIDAQPPIRVQRVGNGTSERFLVAANGNRHQHYVKCYPDASGVDVAREARTLRWLAAALNHSGLVYVPQAVAWEPDRRWIMVEYAPGAPLARLISQLLGRHSVRGPFATIGLSDFARKIGNALVTLQSLSPEEAGLHALHATGVIERYRAVFAQRLDRFERAGIDRGLVRFASDVASGLRLTEPISAVVPQHSDFGPWNMLWDGSRIVLLDFHNSDSGLAEYDRAFFFVALDLSGLLRFNDLRRLARFQAEFLEATTPGSGVATASAGLQPRQGLFTCLAVMHALYFGAQLLERRTPAVRRMLERTSHVRFVSRWIDALVAGQTAWGF